MKCCLCGQAEAEAAVGEEEFQRQLADLEAQERHEWWAPAQPLLLQSSYAAGG